LREKVERNSDHKQCDRKVNQNYVLGVFGQNERLDVEGVRAHLTAPQLCRSS